MWPDWVPQWHCPTRNDGCSLFGEWPPTQDDWVGVWGPTHQQVKSQVAQIRFRELFRLPYHCSLYSNPIYALFTQFSISHCRQIEEQKYLKCKHQIFQFKFNPWLPLWLLQRWSGVRCGENSSRQKGWPCPLPTVHCPYLIFVFIWSSDAIELVAGVRCGENSPAGKKVAQDPSLKATNLVSGF